MADGLDALLDEVEAKFCREISLSPRPSATLKAEKDKERNTDSVYKYRITDEFCRWLHLNISTPALESSIPNPLEIEGIDNNIEAVLQEILHDDDDEDYPALSSHRAVLAEACAPESCSQLALKKCCPVYLGGSAIANGLGTNITPRACDRLRCTSCDFRVVLFNDKEWDASCDYLFFRNNMPDCNKLRVKLKKRQGSRAYSCQCSWHSAVALSELRNIPKLKWVCGQHTVC